MDSTCCEDPGIASAERRWELLLPDRLPLPCDSPPIEGPEGRPERGVLVPEEGAVSGWAGVLVPEVPEVL
jgi:hypothetical protein